jgi:hypothetical protein
MGEVADSRVVLDDGGGVHNRTHADRSTGMHDCMGREEHPAADLRAW